MSVVVWNPSLLGRLGSFVKLRVHWEVKGIG
jgi:hypothetical protein